MLGSIGFVGGLDHACGVWGKDSETAAVKTGVRGAYERNHSHGKMVRVVGAVAAVIAQETPQPTKPHMASSLPACHACEKDTPVKVESRGAQSKHQSF